MRSSKNRIVFKKVTDILRCHSITRAAIFGSFARGDENADSDIDILIEPAKPISLFQILRIEKEINQVTKRKIDLVEFTALKKSIRKSVLEDAVTIL